MTTACRPHKTEVFFCSQTSKGERSQGCTPSTGLGGGVLPTSSSSWWLQTSTYVFNRDPPPRPLNPCLFFPVYNKRHTHFDSYLKYICKDPISKKSHTPRFWVDTTFCGTPFRPVHTFHSKQHSRKWRESSQELAGLVLVRVAQLSQLSGAPVSTSDHHCQLGVGSWLPFTDEETEA